MFAGEARGRIELAFLLQHGFAQGGNIIGGQRLTRKPADDIQQCLKGGRPRVSGRLADATRH